MNIDNNKYRDHNNYYLTHLNGIITDIYASHMEKAQKSHEIKILSLLGFLIIAPVIVYLFFSNTLVVIIFSLAFLLDIFLISYTVKKRNKKVKDFLYKVHDAHLLFNIIDCNQNTFDELKQNNALIFYAVPTDDILDLLYNVLNNMNALKEKNLNIYKFTFKDLSDKYNFDSDKISRNECLSNEYLFCFKMNDLQISDENIKEFTNLKHKLRLLYFDDFILNL